MKTKNVIRNVLPSLAVMVAGLLGAYMVYQNYFEDNIALQISTYEPAAGDEPGATLGEGAAVSESTVEVIETETDAEALADENVESGTVTVETTTETREDGTTVTTEETVIEETVTEGTATE